MSENTKKEPKSWEIFSAGELLCARLSSEPFILPVVESIATASVVPFHPDW